MSSTDFRTCSVCQLERETASSYTASDHVCDFCVEAGHQPPTDAPKQAPEPKKRGRKPKPKVETPPPEPQNGPQDEIGAAAGEPYVAPQFDAQAAAADPRRELAMRTLCRRRLMPFIQRFRPKYMPGWVHHDICRRLERFVEAVERGEEPRLLLMCPPRAGKSEIGSRHFPAWVMGRHPDWEIISASHSSSLTLSFSRYIRDLMRNPAYQAIFPDARLDPSSQSVENWNMTSGGGYLAAGVGTGITGRGCFTGETLIHSECGLIEIEHLVRLYKRGRAPRVLAYDHEAQRSEYRDVLAAYEESTEELVELVFGDGHTVRCTPNHTVFVEGRGYVAAEVLGGGETVFLAEDLPRLQQVQEPGQQGVPGVLREHPTDGGRAFVFELRDEVQAPAVRGGEIRATWSHGQLLLEGLQRGTSRGEERQAVHGLRDSGASNWEVQRGEVLLRDMSGGSTAGEATGGVSGVRRIVYAATLKARSLFSRVRGLGARHGHARRQEPELQGRNELPDHLLQAPAADPAAGQALLRRVREQGGSARASHRRGEDARRAGKSGDALQPVPSHAPQLFRGTVALARRVRCEPVSVYDLQVEGHSNYFAESLLVHNCHILLLDDLVKDIEAADSPTIRDNTWEWYVSTAYSRLAPGAGVLGIMTWWNEDDWAGRIQQVMKSGEGDKFEIVRYPAINEEGDEYILEDDTIVEIPPGSPVPEGARMTRPHNTALHPERYSTAAMLRKKANYIAAGLKRMWQSLYQQNPTPDSGIYFTKDLFRRYAHAPNRRGRTVYQAWDFAITEGAQNDWTVCVTLLQDEFDNLFVLDVFRFKSNDGNAIVEHMIDQWVAWNVDYLGVEDGQIWKTLRAQFEKRCQERRVYPTTEVLQPLTDKLVRANPLKGRMQLGKVYFPEDSARPWVEPFVRELLVFPGGKHDDQVDAMAWAVRLTLNHAAPRDPSPPKPKEKGWRDKLRSMMNSSDAGHMAS